MSFYEKALCVLLVPYTIVMLAIAFWPFDRKGRKL